MEMFAPTSAMSNQAEVEEYGACVKNCHVKQAKRSEEDEQTNGVKVMGCDAVECDGEGVWWGLSRRSDRA